MTITADDAPGQDVIAAEAAAGRIQDLLEVLGQEVNTREIVEESLADAQLALEDIGWRRIAAESMHEFTRDGLKNAANLCRIYAVMNPLGKRALNIRTAYIWGGGQTVTARATGDNEPGPDGTAKTGQDQDVNTLVQEFWDDQANKAAFTSQLAHEENERVLGTDGNFFLCLFTSPLTGKVQVRSFPFDEIVDIIYNPDDRDDPWYYKRVWVRETVELTLTGARTAKTSVTTYYPAVSYYPAVRPRTIDDNKVEWGSPILHLPVNRLDGWKFGIGDLYAALPWLRAYKEGLDDWRLLVKSLSKYAWKIAAPARAQQQVRTRATQPPAFDPLTGLPRPEAGSTALVSPNATLEAVPKTGATIDSNSFRPMAAMVAAATDVPVTMLLGDPGITGARATAETLDTPTQLMAQMRRTVWADFEEQLLNYVIDQAVIAPRGPLKGSISRDVVTGRQVVTLAGDTNRTIDTVFPDLEDTPVNLIVQGITAADGTGKMPPLLTARLLMQAFNVDDIDEWLEKLTDDQGNFVSPNVTAGQVAVAAFRNGLDPAAAVYGPSHDAPAPADDGQGD